MNCGALLLDVPRQIETDRLLLRCPQAGDGPIVFESVHTSLTQLKPWMIWARDEYSLKDAEEWCRQAAGDFLLRKAFQFIVLSRSGGHFGNISLFAIDWNIPKCEMGYWIRTSETGKGFMTEAVNGLTLFAARVLKMARVEVRTDNRNERSFKVAERAGFTLEGVLRQDSRDVGGLVRDTRIYSTIFPVAQDPRDFSES